MSIPETLREAVADARSMITRANEFDVGFLTGNAKVTLSNAQAFVVDDAVIEEAFHLAKQRIEFMRQAGPIELQKARVSALQALDSLELSLVQARPNDMAKALGLDWL